MHKMKDSNTLKGKQKYTQTSLKARANTLPDLNSTVAATSTTWQDGVCCLVPLPLPSPTSPAAAAAGGRVTAHLQEQQCTHTTLPLAVVTQTLSLKSA
jgi:hypothetical protein